MIVTKYLSRGLLDHPGIIEAMYDIIARNMREIFDGETEDDASRAKWYENCVLGVANNPDWRTVLALDGNELCGYFQYGRRGTDCIWSELEIAPARQGDGATLHALLLAFLEDLDFSGYDTVSGYINDKNIKSQEVFAHIGLARREAVGNGARYAGRRVDVERWARRSILTGQLSASNPDHIALAAKLLQQGELVAIPTETVYGLAANALNPEAVAKIFEAKGRPQDNPLIVHILSLEDAVPLVKKNPAQAHALAEKFWPGPLTIVLEKTDMVPDIVSAGLSTVALRSPSHPAARELLRACGFPLAAPSANRSGAPSPTKAQHVLDDLPNIAVLDGGACDVGVESTVITLATPTPMLLRPGGISLEDLRSVLGTVGISAAITQALQADEKAPSPGMKHRHYAPKAELTLVHGALEDVIAYAKEHSADGILCFDDNPEEQARQLFAKLRELDAQGLQKVFVHCPKKEGLGLAVYNRLLRASEFREVTLVSKQ